MAIAFAQVSIHSRAKGHSAVAAAAYRSASKLLDERTGITYDFTHRKDVIFTETLLPEGVNIAFENRELLWNAVESSEKRVDSQVCKDIVLALPKELDLTQQIELAKRFAHTHFVSEGIPCDVAIHDHVDGNPHAHLLISTRRLEKNGFSMYKARDLNPSFYLGKVIENDFWGEQWGNAQNIFFKENGLDFSVDLNHVISERHQGKVRDTDNHYIKQENEIIKNERVDLALNHIDNIINHISLTHSVFTRRDIERLLFKTLGKEDTNHSLFTGLVEQVISHKSIIGLGSNDEGRDSYTTRNQYIAESTLLSQVDSMASKSTHVFHQEIASFANSYNLNEEQAQALEYLVKGTDLSVMVGRPGVGKSYLLKPLGEYYQTNGCRVLGAALSGKVAKSLQTETGFKSYTIASLTYRLSHNQLTLNQNDVLVVDEAGMVDFSSMSALINAAHKARAKVILIGDPNQLKPIHKGEIFKGILARTGYIELCEIRRQRDVGDRAASLDLSKGNIEKALMHYEQKGAIRMEDTPHDSAKKLVSDWQASIQSLSDIKEHSMFSFTRAAVSSLNEQARSALKENGLLSRDDMVFTRWVDEAISSNFIESREINITVGERIMLRKNDKTLGVRNGDFAQVESLSSAGITARLDSGERVIIPRTYHHIDYGYATTVHKGQGMTVDKASILVDSQYWDRNLSFVAMTRHRDELSIYVDRAQHADINALKTTLSRESTKDNVIDWPLDFAIRAGFDPDKMLGRALNQMAGIGHKIKEKWNYVVNFETYIKQRDVAYQLDGKQARRSMAKEVADYIDTQSRFSKVYQAVKRESVRLGVEQESTPSFNKLYAAGQIRDKQAHALWTKHSERLVGVSINKFNPENLEKASVRYDHYLIIKAIIENSVKTPDEQPKLAEQSSQINLKTDYACIRREAEKSNLKLSVLCDRIEQYQKVHRLALYEIIKKEHPIVARYEMLLTERNSLTGPAGDKLDKELLVTAKTITADKLLYLKIERQLPKLADRLKKRIEHERGKDRGIDR